VIRRTLTALMPPRRAATLRDVAREAGVSIATASYVLNGKGRVGEETRRRVLDTAARLEFRVDPRGRALRVGRSQSVGLLLPPVDPDRGPRSFTAISFYSEFAAGAADAAFERSHALVLLPQPARESDLASFGLAGLLLCDPVRGDARLAMADALELPVVSIEPDPDARDTREGGWIGADNAGNTRTLLEHLGDRGARRIALIAPSVQWAWVLGTRGEYLRWCAESGHEPAIVASGDATALSRLLERDRPDAILALSENAAATAIRIAADHGLGVPSDLLVVAGVDGAMAQLHDPPITAIDLLPRRQARLAVDRVISLSAGESPGPPIALVGELRVRRSSTPDDPAGSAGPEPGRGLEVDV
jgi:DNA-binding LacI/PurR family transcriptional regulator